MRTKITAVLAAALVMSGILAGNAYAPPDPNGPAKKGLCNAYFRGSDNGRAHKRNSSAFQALEQAAGVEEGDSPADRDMKVMDFCGS